MGPNPENIPTESDSTTVFKDRSTGLIVFGAFTILLGCLAGLFALLILGTAASVGHTETAAASPFGLLPAVLIYVVLAVFLIWTGIGSIMARRWARALIVIFSWCWLVLGIVDTICVPFFMAKVFANLSANSAKGQPPVPAAAVTVMVVVMVLIFGFFFVLLPAIWTSFYMSRHVKATCERRDAVTRWTDACPLPVLGLCLWLLSSVPILVLFSFIAPGAFPFFGAFLPALPGSLLCLAMAALWAYAAWLLYRLDVRGWWITLIAMIVYTASAMVTFARHDVLEMYQRMGFSQQQMDQIQKAGIFTGNNMEWMMLLFIVPFLAYFLFVKRYFEARVS